MEYLARFLIQADVIGQFRSETFHLVERLRLRPRIEVEPEQREQRDQQSQRGRDQRLRHTRRDLRGGNQARPANYLEGLHHASDGAQQTHQRGRGHDGFEHPEAAAQGLFDLSRFVTRARFHPPRGMIAVRGYHTEKSAISIMRSELLNLPIQIAPQKAVGFDQRPKLIGQPQTSIVGDRAIQDDDQREGAQEQQRIDHRAAIADRLPRDSEFTHCAIPLNSLHS